MLKRLHAVPLPTRLSWLLPALVTLAGTLLIPLDTDERFRQLLTYAVLLGATLTTAALYWFTTPRPDRHGHATLGVALRGVAIVALAFGNTCGRNCSRWAWLLSTCCVARASRCPLGTTKLDDLERTYAFFDRLTPTPRATRMALQDALLHRCARP